MWGWCLGDDGFVGDCRGEKEVGDGVVDFVGWGMVEVVGFEVNFGWVFLGEGLGKIKW